MKLRISDKSLPHFDKRPAGCAIDTIVLHAMHAKAYADKFSCKNCIKVLDKCKLSAHYLIGRRGQIWRLVSDSNRAWHAGVSRMPFANDKRENVNHFSIGIELIGRENQVFNKAQYLATSVLIKHLCSRHPIINVVGHEHIAPKRKSDPGAKFDWEHLRRLLALELPLKFKHLLFVDEPENGISRFRNNKKIVQ